MKESSKFWMLDAGKKLLMSYKKLQIWILAREVAIEVHEMTMRLPKFEMYEEGSQIRRSGKTTKATSIKVLAEESINRIG